MLRLSGHVATEMQVAFPVISIFLPPPHPLHLSSKNTRFSKKKKKTKSNYSTLSQVTSPSNKMVFNAISKFSHCIFLVNLCSWSETGSNSEAKWDLPIQHISDAFSCSLAFSSVSLTTYYCNVNITWSLYKSETSVEIVGTVPWWAEVPVLRLWNLTWPLNTTPTSRSH